MKLVYIVSKHTTANSDYKLHLPNFVFGGQPLCKSHQRSFSIEFTEAEKPTCKRCLKEYETLIG